MSVGMNAGSSIIWVSPFLYVRSLYIQEARSMELDGNMTFLQEIIIHREQSNEHCKNQSQLRCNVSSKLGYLWPKLVNVSSYKLTSGSVYQYCIIWYAEV